MSKTNILEEIKRTAKTNGGMPLGKQRFFQETGIKESDWSGKFWTKWGDAVQEAGFTPNQKQVAFSDESQLENYALLIRELGRIPTAAEVRMKARNDSSFPSHNTFSRLGSKQQLLSKLLAFCQGNEKYGDLVSILDKQPRIEHLVADQETSVNTDIGHVYLLHFGGEEYKIGCSNNVERRFREI
jgi:hypothetical protein